MDKSLFIWGSPGTGKSVFMASLAKKYVKLGKPVKWISFPAFIMKLQNSFKDNSDETAYDIARKIAHFGQGKQFTSRVYRTPGNTQEDDLGGILFIDDLGAEKLSDYVKQIMYYILNEREERVLQTIISSNLSLSEIDERIADRISSRIAGICEVLKFTGSDRRLKK